MMTEVSCAITVLILLLATGCHSADEIPAARQKVNIEVTGTSECLAQVVNLMADRGGEVAVLPKWSGGVGQMEVGPVEARQYNEVSKAVRAQTCVKAVRSRPCATPHSDLNVC